MTWYDIIWYDMIWYTHIYTHGKNGSIACLSFKCFCLPKPCARECGHSNKYSYIYNSKFDLEHILLSLLISASSGCSFLPPAWWGGRERGAPRTRAQKTITQANIAILSLQLKSWPSMNPWSLLPIVYPVLPFGRTALASMCLAREDCRSGASFMGVWLWDAMGLCVNRVAIAAWCSLRLGGIPQQLGPSNCCDCSTPPGDSPQLLGEHRRQHWCNLWQLSGWTWNKFIPQWQSAIPSKGCKGGWFVLSQSIRRPKTIH